MSTSILLLLLVLFFATPLAVRSGDPDILSDFILPQTLGAPDVNGSFFTYTGTRTVIDSNEPPTFTVHKATMAPSTARASPTPSSNSREIPSTRRTPTLALRSCCFLSLACSTSALSTPGTGSTLKTLQRGDMFVFPKGLVHFQYNKGQEHAVAISASGSANAGTVSVPGSVFAASIDEGVLAKSFKIDVAIVQKIEAGLAPKPKA